MKTLKKLLFIIMAVAVLAMPVFGVQAAESDIPVTRAARGIPDAISGSHKRTGYKGNKIYYYYKGKWLRTNGRDIMAISIILAQMEMLCGEDSVSTM